MDEVIRGWREYSLVDNRKLGILLMGSWQYWREQQLSSSCCWEEEGKYLPLMEIDVKPINGPHSMYQCVCGIYLLKQPFKRLWDFKIIAQAVGWGKVVEHEKGYRVQHCRIDQLYIPQDKVRVIDIDKGNFFIDPKVAAELLEQRYQVPVIIGREAICAVK